MLDGLDFQNDRAWEHTICLRSDPGNAQAIVDVNYPHFRVDPAKRVVKSKGSGPRQKPTSDKGSRFKGRGSGSRSV